MNELLHISSAPHARCELSTKSVMRDVLLSLAPVTIMGIWFHGAYAALVIALSIFSAVLTEYLFDVVTKRKNTTNDGSAIVTGLLLALTLPARVPLYVPVLGAVFAILVVKCLFGGLGHNFMNPALAGRSFLLISFGTAMTGYSVDGVSAATPLAQLAEGKGVDLLALCIGNTSGVIGSSALGLIAGGIYLLMVRGITWEIPTSMLAATAAFLAIFGGHGLDAGFILPHLLGGGLLMAAFFMATDPVTCPSTTKGQLVYGAFTGILIGLFRTKGASADSTTYAVLIANMVSNIIDEWFIPIPFAFRIPKDRRKAIPKPVIILLVITLVAGLALSAVFSMTADQIAENKANAERKAYLQVLPEAENMAATDAIRAAVESSGSFGSVTVLDAVAGTNAAGETVGYVISVRNASSFDGGLALVVGIKTDGTLNGIAFTELHETAGMGMKCGEPAFMDQFAGAPAVQFTLNKGGASSAPDVIDSVNGASVTSGSVVAAVNAAVSFYEANLK